MTTPIRRVALGGREIGGENARCAVCLGYQSPLARTGSANTGRARTELISLAFTVPSASACSVATHRHSEREPSEVECHRSLRLSIVWEDRNLRGANFKRNEWVEGLGWQAIQREKGRNGRRLARGGEGNEQASLALNGKKSRESKAVVMGASSSRAMAPQFSSSDACSRVCAIVVTFGELSVVE